MQTLGNGSDGITLLDSAGNTIGGTGRRRGQPDLGQRQRESAPAFSSPAPAPQNNLVQGNLIGPNSTGTAPLSGGIQSSNGDGIEHR